MRHDLALESQRLERKGTILKQLQASLAKTQAELSASSVDLTERHRAIVKRAEELDQRELTITEREKEARQRETDLASRERAFKQKDAAWQAQQDTIASEHEAQLAEVENQIRHNEDLAIAKATSTLSDAHCQTIKEIEEAAHRREVDQREATARRETELQDLLKQAQEKAASAAAEAAQAREFAADRASDELQQAQQAWAEARSAAENAEYREERLRKREKEFDARLEQLDQQHKKRAKELQGILDAIEARNSQLSQRQTEISAAETSLKRREQQWEKTHREQLDSLDSQRDRSAQWAQERAKLTDRAENAETRLVAAQAELSQLRTKMEMEKAQGAEADNKLQIASTQELEEKYRMDRARSDEMWRKKLESTRHELETAREHLETKELARQALETQLVNDAARCSALEDQNHSLLEKLSLAQPTSGPSTTNTRRKDTNSGGVDPALRLSQAMELDAKVLLPLGEQLRHALNAQRNELDHLRKTSAQSQREIAALRDSNENLRESEESLQRSFDQAHSTRESSPPNGLESAAMAWKSTSTVPLQRTSDPVTMAHLSSSAAQKPGIASAALKYSSPAAVSLRAQLMELQQSIQETLDDSGSDQQVHGSEELFGDTSIREPTQSTSPNTTTPVMRVSPKTSGQSAPADDKLRAGSRLDDRPIGSINFAFVDQLAALTTARVLAAAHLSRLGNICENLGPEKRNAFESRLEVLRKKQTAFFEEEQTIRQATDHAGTNGEYSTEATQARLEQFQNQLSIFSDEVGDLLRKAKVAHSVQAEARAQSRRDSPASDRTERPMPNGANEISGPSLLSSVYLRAASSTTEARGEDNRHRRHEWEESQFDGGVAQVGFGQESMGSGDSLDRSDNMRSNEQLKETGNGVDVANLSDSTRLQTAPGQHKDGHLDIEDLQ